jgi:1,2-dihydroxy-3-keto-5-methylthiopentene dioxygenase
MVVVAWYMDDSAEDQRAPHQCVPPRPVSAEELAALGVLQWHLTADE